MPEPVIGKAAPDFTLPTDTGESFRLSALPVPGAIADATPAGPLAGYP